MASTLGTLSVRGDGVATDGLLPGDADRNGTVALDDLTILGTFFGGAGDWDNANFDSSVDGVQLNDLTLLGTFFNQSTMPPALGASVAAVPEPSTAVLLCLAGVALFSRRRRS